MSINETVLEMHFHKELLDIFRNTLGLGKGAINFYKYSTQRECFVGFDQAYIQTDLSDEELFQKLKNSAMNNGYRLPNPIVGYFLQYKVVKQMQKHVRHTPLSIRNIPHQRVALDTTKNITTGFSQHELLYNLKRNQGAFVYYACPMIFDRVELYNQKPDLNRLRLVDFSSCPSDYSDNEKHFIYFNDINSNPVWCSEPTEGKAIIPSEFALKICDLFSNAQNKGSQVELFEKLRKPLEIKGSIEKITLLNLVADSLIILEIKE